jgi:glycosyltransferase involved in cell wall biosynthesis
MNGRRIKIGLWCDYGFTLKPMEGIGVFVANLVRGIAQLDDPPELCILVHPGDEDVYDPYTEGLGSRLTVISIGKSRLTRVRARLRAGWHGLQLVLGHARFFWQRAYGVMGRLMGASPDAALLRRLFPPGDERPIEVSFRLFPELIKIALVLLVSLGFAFTLSIVLFAGGVIRSLLKVPETLLYRLYLVIRWVLDYYGSHHRDLVARRAGCDVWVLPYLGMSVPRVGCPYLVIVHDLVYRHYPESFTKEHYDLLERMVQAITRSAAICACASDFILKTDLLGVLGLPKGRTRRVGHSPPRDILSVEPTPPDEMRERLGVHGPYLLYPSAFRGYKNHAVLVAALAELHRRGRKDMKLVFTGKLPVPAFIKEPITTYTMEKHVCLVGQVSREDLAALYLGAEACVVPTLYEQGSFPVLEAMSLACPVACSKIPPLVEQHRDDPEAMVFFDPSDVMDVVRAIERLLSEREEIVARQTRAFEDMCHRTWKDVAADWVEVCRDAVELGPPPPVERSLPEETARKAVVA